MKERNSEREIAEVYNRLHCIEVVYQTILHRSLFIDRQRVVSKNHKLYRVGNKL